MQEYKVKYDEAPVRLLQTIDSDHEYIKEIKSGNSFKEIKSRISFKETFPLTENEGKYSLEISKVVEDQRDLYKAKNIIIPMFFKIASFWHIAGGSQKLQNKYYSKEELNYSDNFDEINQAFMEKLGSTRVYNSINLPASNISTYKCLPLKNALDIYDLYQIDSSTGLILDFYNQSLQDYSAWYAHLYKIKEILQVEFGDIDTHGNRVKYEKILGDTLGIPSNEFNEFGKLLNNKEDTRHFKVNEEKISRDEKEKLFQIARDWIRKYIEFKLERKLFN